MKKNFVTLLALLSGLSISNVFAANMYFSQVPGSLDFNPALDTWTRPQSWCIDVLLLPVDCGVAGLPDFEDRAILDKFRLSLKVYSGDTANANSIEVGNSSSFTILGSLNVTGSLSLGTVFGFGSGSLTQGIATIGNLTVGKFAHGQFSLGGLGANLQELGGTLNTTNVVIGESLVGFGEFFQTSGTHTIASDLKIGVASTSSSSSLYHMEAGVLESTDAYIGVGSAGVFELVEGTNNISNDLVLGHLVNGFGTYELSRDGVLSVGNESIIGQSGAGFFNHTDGSHSITNNLIVGSQAGSRGQYAFQNGVLNAGNQTIGSFGEGEFIQSGSTNSIAGTLNIGRFSGSDGVYHLNAGTLVSSAANVGVSGSGQFFLNSGSRQQVNGKLSVGSGLPVVGTDAGIYHLNGGRLDSWAQTIGGEGVGFLIQSAGMNIIAGEMTLADSGALAEGFYTLSGGELSAISEVINNNGANAIFTQNGISTNTTSTLTLAKLGGTGRYVLNGGELIVGDIINGAGTGSLVLNGGTLTMLKPSSSLDVDNFILGTTSTGTGNFFQANGLNANVSDELRLGDVAGSTGTYTVFSGDMIVNKLTVGHRGNGNFSQLRDVTVGEGGLVLGYFGAGAKEITYTLSGGILLAPVEVINRCVDSASFIQQTGFNTTDSLVLGQLDCGGGTYSLQGGTLRAKDISLSNLSVFDFTGGTLVVGNYGGDLNNNGGEISAVTDSVIQGNYTQSATSKYNAILDRAVNDNGRLIISGEANLQGSLQVFYADRANVVLGDSFDILSAETITGGFDTITFPRLRIPNSKWKIEVLTDEIGTTDVIRVSLVEGDVLIALNNVIDPNLNSCIRAAVTFISSPEELKALNCSNKSIVNLSGLEQFSGLTDLLLFSNQIIDISPVAALINLTRINLGNNQVVDISPLSGLSSLTILALNDNRICDLRPLSQLSSTNLTIFNNPVCDFDTDGDGMTDDFEASYLLLKPLLDDSAGDIDLDGLTNLQEFILGTNPDVADSDSDNISDNQEVILGTNPLLADTDLDLVNDDIDVFPLDINEWADNDKDSLGDNADTDDDNDGISDANENLYGLDPFDSSDANIDSDGDGISNIDEVNNGTHPLQDEEAPVIVAPANITVIAIDASDTAASNSAISAFLSGAIATDNVDGAITTIGNDAPAIFPLGVTAVTFSAIDIAGNTGSAQATVTIDDQTVPVISLIGNSEIILVTGAVFTDPGTTATDNIDGDLSGSVQVSGSVDINVAGSYTLTYSVSDAAGNAAQPVSRQVTVSGDFDGDGLPDAYEDANGLNKNDPTDAAGDRDGDGISNLDEYRDAFNIFVDEVPPIFVAPDDLIIDATGHQTAVDLSPIDVVDSKDGILQATADNLGPFTSGTHTITWSVTDLSGNTTTDTQLISILPLVSFGQDVTIGEGQTVSIDVTLSGVAPSYPVTINYAIDINTSTSDSNDHDLLNGSITIDQGLSATITFNTANDGISEGNETLILTLDSATNTAIGSDDQITLTLVEVNIQPMVRLSMTQASTPTLTADSTGGLVMVQSAIIDPNVGDQHTYDWSLTDNNLADLDNDDATLTFDPSSLPDGVYTIILIVTDSGGLSSQVSQAIRKISTPITLPTTVDTDGDGASDADEGNGDSDGDGIEDYRDNSQQPAHVLPIGNGRYLSSQNGLILTIGKTAFAANSSTATTTENDIGAHGVAVAGVNVADDLFTHQGEIFDFIINGLGQPGDKVSIIISISQPIPANAVYRKFLPAQGWVTLEAGNGYAIASATSQSGVCPDQTSNAYQSGLNENDDCVKLTLVDGGFFDGDGLVNGSIADPGVIAIAASSDTGGGSNVNTTDSTGSSGGGGVFSIKLLFAVMLLIWLQAGMRQLARRK